jgi:hypothetical protein
VCIIKISCIVYTQTWIQVFLIQVFLNGDLDAKLVSCIPGLTLHCTIIKYCLFVHKIFRHNFQKGLPKKLSQVQLNFSGKYWRKLFLFDFFFQANTANLHNYLCKSFWLVDSIRITRTKFCFIPSHGSEEDFHLFYFQPIRSICSILLTRSCGKRTSVCMMLYITPQSCITTVIVSEWLLF